jgi:hypothetical protein
MLENNIKMDLSDIGWCDVGWINLAQDVDHWKVLMNTAMNFWVP